MTVRSGIFGVLLTLIVAIVQDRPAGRSAETPFQAVHEGLAMVEAAETGTGFCVKWDAQKNISYFLTANHVIQKHGYPVADPITLYPYASPGKRLAATVVPGRHEGGFLFSQVDIALLEVEGFRCRPLTLHTIPTGASQKGWAPPIGIDGYDVISLADWRANLAARPNAWPVPAPNIGLIRERLPPIYLVTAAAANPGDSGAPLFDISSRTVYAVVEIITNNPQVLRVCGDPKTQRYPDVQQFCNQNRVWWSLATPLNHIWKRYLEPPPVSLAPPNRKDLGLQAYELSASGLACGGQLANLSKAYVQWENDRSKVQALLAIPRGDPAKDQLVDEAISEGLAVEGADETAMAAAFRSFSTSGDDYSVRTAKRILSLVDMSDRQDTNSAALRARANSWIVGGSAALPRDLENAWKDLSDTWLCRSSGQ